jgi:hypothetical protein
VKRLATALLILLLAAVSLVVVRAAGSAGQSTDPDRVAAQLERLRLPDGRITPPRPRGAPSLESTGWAWLTIGMSGAKPAQGVHVDVATMTDLRDGNGPHDDLWENFYIVTAAQESGTALSASNRTALIDAIVARRSAPGYFSEDDDPQRTADHAHRIMATWAAVSSLALLDATDDLGATRRWLHGVLDRCDGNAFLLGHAAEALDRLDPTARPGTAPAGCADDGAPSQHGDPAPPTTEEQLLQLHGEILATPDAQARLRYTHVLTPRRDWFVDPWWTGHAIRAYAAAGGDPANYRSLADQIAQGVDANGLAATFEIPTPTAESDFEIIRIAQASGLDPAKFVAPATLRARAASESQAWSGADWAPWVRSMKALGSDIPQARRADLNTKLVECAAEPATPSTFRTVALCITALTDLGQHSGELGWRGDTWAASPDAAIAQCAAVLPGCEDQQIVRQRMPAALANLLATPANVPTPVLAALPDAARRTGAALSDKQLAIIRDELNTRRGSNETDALYRLARDAPVIDFTSTAAALSFHRQDAQ